MPVSSAQLVFSKKKNTIKIVTIVVHGETSAWRIK